MGNIEKDSNRVPFDQDNPDHNKITQNKYSNKVPFDQDNPDHNKITYPERFDKEKITPNIEVLPSNQIKPTILFDQDAQDLKETKLFDQDNPDQNNIASSRRINKEKIPQNIILLPTNRPRPMGLFDQDAQDLKETKLSNKVRKTLSLRIKRNK